MKQKKIVFWSTMFLLIFAINTVVNIGQQMVNTLVPKYAASLSNAASVVGIVGGMFSFSALLLRPFTSPAFDSFSKKRMLQIALLVLCATMLLYASADSIPVILFARAMHGMSYGCIATLCLAFAGDSLPTESLGSGIGIFALAQAVAQAIGPSIGLWVQRMAGYSGAFLAGLFMMVIAFVMTCFLREINPAETRPPYRLRWNNIIAREAVKPSVILFFMALAQASIVSFLVIYGELRGIADVGLYFTAHAICLFISRPIAGKLSDKFGFEKVIIPGIICSICAFWVISCADRVEYMILAGMLAAFGFGATQPAIQAMSIKRVPQQKRGAGANTNYIFTDLGAIGGSYLVGAVIDLLRSTDYSLVEAYSAAFRVMTIPMVIAVIYAVFAFGVLPMKRGEGHATD